MPTWDLCISSPIMTTKVISLDSKSHNSLTDVAQESWDGISAPDRSRSHQQGSWLLHGLENIAPFGSTYFIPSQRIDCSEAQARLKIESGLVKGITALLM